MGEDGDDADDDAEEDDDLKDGGEPGLGEDGRPQGMTPKYEPEDRVDGLGKVVDQQGVKLYQTGKSGTGVGVMLISDFFGWTSGRTRAIADYMAENLNAFCVVPRLLDTPAFDASANEDGLPDDFDMAARQKEVRSWLMKYVWQTFKPKIETAAVHLRNNGAKRIAGVGFSFGAWAVCKAAEMINEFVCCTLFYPSVHFMEDLTDGDYVRLAGKVKGPILFLPGRAEQNRYGPEGDMFEQVLQNHPNDAESMPFDDMEDDWVLRGNIRQEAIHKAAAKAVHTATKYCRKYLWPLPAGANAATLRLMCQEGDHDFVAQLLSSGVPAFGKHVVDIIGLEPIHYAAKTENSTQPIRMLVEYEADVNVTGGIAGETPLHIAASVSSQKAVKQLLSCNANTEAVDKGGQTALHFACKNGCLPIVKLLLQAKADMNARDDPPQQTPMHLAAWFGREHVVTFLLQMRMDIDVEDLRVQTPQKRALQQGFDAIADIFEAERERRKEEEFERQQALAVEAAKTK